MNILGYSKKSLGECSSREKSNPLKSKRDFLMFSLISGRHVSAPQRDTNMVFPY